MIDTKSLVLDANILLRAVFGVRVRHLLTTHADTVSFFTPDICVLDAQRYIPDIAAQRRADPVFTLALLDKVTALMQVVERSDYALHETRARARIERRDPDDWPVVAVALRLDCPVWTEDRDFFGCGLATWNTANLEIYFETE